MMLTDKDCAKLDGTDQESRALHDEQVDPDRYRAWGSEDVADFYDQKIIEAMARQGDEWELNLARLASVSNPDQLARIKAAFEDVWRRWKAVLDEEGKKRLAEIEREVADGTWLPF